tara:strand:+ start:4538 stop:6157 length:1620 start_codon:yes stop_codon:yes gene_type:complete
MASSSPESDGASLTLNALDGGTLAKVYAHLDPRDIVRVSASSKHLASAADEPLYKELFDKAWDEPAWPVASHKELFLARHRATVASSAVDPAPMIASVESLAALKRGDKKKTSSAHLKDDARWRVVAEHAETLAHAVNASEKIKRTDRTIACTNVVRGLHRWLIELTTMAHARKRCLAGNDWWPATGNRALLGVARALSACLTRCPSVRESLKLDVRPEMFSHVPEHPPLRSLLRLCTAAARDKRAALGCGGLAGVSPFDSDETLDDDFGGVDEDHGVVDDATLAAAMGGTSVGIRVWPPEKSLPPRVDQCLALVVGPLCLLSTRGGETRDSTNDESETPVHEYQNLHGGMFDVIPIPASIPSAGPWPRGGRPPHGQRLRLEKTGAPSTVASMSGAWLGVRFGFENDLSVDGKLTLDTMFRIGLTALPDGKLTGWIRDTLGELVVRGSADPSSDGDGAVTIEAKFTRCGDLPAAALVSWRHGRPRMRLRGWTSSASIAGEWTQWSGGALTRGVFLMWPDDKVRGGSSRGSSSAGGVDSR